LLRTAAGALGAAASLVGTAHAQAPAKHRRLNVCNPRAARAVESYKKAIRAMLALPPTDPRN
jgi:tyrosinase